MECYTYISLHETGLIFQAHHPLCTAVVRLGSRLFSFYSFLRTQLLYSTLNFVYQVTMVTRNTRVYTDFVSMATRISARNDNKIATTLDIPGVQKKLDSATLTFHCKLKKKL